MGTQKEKEEGINFKLGARSICALFFLGGFFLIALSCIEFAKPAAWWEVWGKGTVNNAGTTLIVAGVVSFLMEISTLKNFFRSLLQNILNEDFPFEAYSKENLIKFKKSISAYLSGDDMDKDYLCEKTVYSFENKLLEIASDLYYEYFNADYVVYPKEEEGKIRINATLDYKIVNRFDKQNDIRFKTKTYAGNEQEAKDSFSLKKLLINKKPVDTKELVTIEKIEKGLESNFYDYKVKIKKDLGKARFTTVHMEYEYFLPISDRLQNYKVTLPCQKMEHVIRIKGGWALRGSAYTAFYTKQDDPDCKYMIEQKDQDLIRIRFKDWVLPGGGYSIYYDNKS